MSACGMCLSRTWTPFATSISLPTLPPCGLYLWLGPIRGNIYGHLGKDLGPLQKFRLYQEPSSHDSNPLMHPDQSNSNSRVAGVRVKSPAVILDTKAQSTLVRAKFHVCVLSVTMLNDVSERFLGNPK